jgi:hypothetical protein
MWAPVKCILSDVYVVFKSLGVIKHDDIQEKKGPPPTKMSIFKLFS